MRVIFGKSVYDTIDELVDPAHAALVVIDMQNGTVHPDGMLARAGVDVSLESAIMQPCGDLVRAARDAGVRVVHVGIHNLPEGESSPPSWLRGMEIIAGGHPAVVQSSWDTTFCDDCAPAAGEPVVMKRRSSGFFGTDLDLVLRAGGVETVVAIGVQTPGCVDATIRDASYLGYYTVVVEDCVAAADPELHDAAMKIIRTRHDVASSAEVVAAWSRATAGTTNAVGVP